MKRIFIAALLMLMAGGAGTAYAQKYKGLAMTPPMGWNSWNNFACNVNEELIRKTADALVEKGLKDAGYIYVNIDDCWHGERDAQGFITANKEHFPSGIKALADYVHAKGLKLGIYSDAGWETCGHRPGSRGYEYQDALTYASWGVDYLKYDWCATEGLNGLGAYLTIREALAKAGRPIVLSICEWGHHKPWEWAQEVGHLWRTTGDITNCFDCVDDHGTWKSFGIMKIVDMQVEMNVRTGAGPDHWNDPDMMEVGNGMTLAQDRSHFSLWAMLAAPLIMGNDVVNMRQETLEILTNRDVIAVDQDPLGIQGFRHSQKDSIEVWMRPLDKGDWALLILNRSGAPQKVDFDFSREQIYDPLSKRYTAFETTNYSVKDLWSKKSLGTTATPIAVTLPAHDVLMVRLDNPRQ